MIQVNLGKAKDIAHNIRRDKRSEEFKPLDIEATIPYLAQEAEAKRQLIRDKYDQLQQQIEMTSNIEEIKEVITTLVS